MDVNIQPTAIPGVLLCARPVLRDARGFFSETYHERQYRERGIAVPFVQDNFSHSAPGTLRGLHYQLHRPQAKLVTVLRGAIYDVAVDVRRGSPTFGRWVGAILSADNARQLFMPAGFAHGFRVLDEEADVLYKCTDFYDPADERGLAWDDPDLAIDWPEGWPILSARDSAHPRLRDATAHLTVYAG